MTNKNKLKTTYKTFFWSFVNMFILAKNVKKTRFLNLIYRKKDLDFEDKKFKKNK